MIARMPYPKIYGFRYWYFRRDILIFLTHKEPDLSIRLFFCEQPKCQQVILGYYFYIHSIINIL